MNPNGSGDFKMVVMERSAGDYAPPSHTQMCVPHLGSGAHFIGAADHFAQNLFEFQRN
jgi:hypothetical protein